MCKSIDKYRTYNWNNCRVFFVIAHMAYTMLVIWGWEQSARLVSVSKHVEEASLFMGIWSGSMVIKAVSLTNANHIL